jgi:protein MAK11
MPKRKRGTIAGEAALPNGKVLRLDPTADDDGDINVRLITGSYERILHGINVRIPKELLKRDTPDPPATFTDSFLFNAHASAIRALALSPPSAPGPAQKRILATGGTDARINLYNLSTHAPRPSLKSLSLTPDASSSNGSSNKSLGALHAHDASVTALHFPTRGKLVSACAANALAVTSTRTWATLAVLRAPVPRQPNRPAGDTAGRATLPQGVNGLAVHPSRRLMLSVGRAERCLRLWNLTTGRRAGVLEFGREVLGAVGEGVGRWSGEGRSVAWDAEGTRFVVGWGAGAVVYGQVSGF